MSASIHPYDPPQSDAIPDFRAPTLKDRNLWRSPKLLGISAGLLIFGLGIHQVLPEGAKAIGSMIMAGGDVIALTAAVLAGLDAIFVLRRHGLPKVAALFGLLAVAAVNVAMGLTGSIITLLSINDFRRGRQLRQGGRLLLPPVIGGGDWAASPIPGLTAEFIAKARVTAAQWRENARTEHASVAAFAAHTTDLMALGAPPALLMAANRDALDEIRHTELCFSLASALDGVRQGPGPFPAARRAAPASFGRTHALARLAATSLIDGALHEGVSARVLAKLARRCESVGVKAMLKGIARDEGRHAAHGWDVVVWCVEEGGAPVVKALEAAVRALPEEMTSPLPEEARLGGWERLGIHGQALERAEYKAALADVRRRVDALEDGAPQVAAAC